MDIYYWHWHLKKTQIKLFSYIHVLEIQGSTLLQTETYENKEKS